MWILTSGPCLGACCEGTRLSECLTVVLRMNNTDGGARDRRQTEGVGDCYQVNTIYQALFRKQQSMSRELSRRLRSYRAG